MKIQFLIADRNPRVADKLRRGLLDRGYDVRIATTGLDCVAQLRETCPRVLVLDPGMLWGGTEGVLDWLQDQPFPVVPTVVLAGAQDGSSRLDVSVDAQLKRPEEDCEFTNFVDQLEALAWWTAASRNEPVVSPSTRPATSRHRLAPAFAGPDAAS